MPVSGPMSTPRNDFQVSLMRDLVAIGTAEEEAKAYVEDLRRGETLVFASGPEEKIEAAAAIMNRRGPAEAQELMEGERHLPAAGGVGRPLPGSSWPP